MRIVTLTNTYDPIVGGLEKSVRALAAGLTARGHEVRIVAPTFGGMPTGERNVIRVPALHNVAGTEFSVQLPVPGAVTAGLADFAADLVHTHHPYLLGDTAMRLAAARDLPLVFTYHTMYERYTHYLPVDTGAVKTMVAELAAGYAGLCDLVFAPSVTVRDVLRDRDVTTPVRVVPTGIDVRRFAGGDGGNARRKLQIPPQVPVIGHVGRLAPEKNVDVLMAALAATLARHPEARALIVGDGPSRKHMVAVARQSGVAERMVFTGSLRGDDLVDAYHAMDLFAFASRSETQGLVLVEAMAAGLPVVALRGPAVGDIVCDADNGLLVDGCDDPGARLGAALHRVLTDTAARAAMGRAAHATAGEYDEQRCVDRALEGYEAALAMPRRGAGEAGFGALLRGLAAHWQLTGNLLAAVGRALRQANIEDQDD